MLDDRFASGQVKLTRGVVLAIQDFDPDLEFRVNLVAIESRQDRPSQQAWDDEEMGDRVSIDVECASATFLEVQDLSAVVEAGLDQITPLEEGDRFPELA